LNRGPLVPQTSALTRLRHAPWVAGYPVPSDGMSRSPLDPLDLPQPRWRLAIRRLPVTLAVLAVVGGGAAGLVYVASGSGVHHFPARLVNDLGYTVEVGACEQDDCKKGGMLAAVALQPKQQLLVGVRTASVVNPILVTTPEAKRIGCFFLRYPKEPVRPVVVWLTNARPC
jgi:hypothetical protein